MKKFDTQYVDSNTYPIRLDTCLENLCSQVGLTLGNKNFPNNSYMLKGNPFTNKETRKTVLSNLVQLAGGFAEIDVEDGKLYVRNLDVSGEAVETIDGNNYDEFKPNNVFGPVNSVRIQMNSGVDGEETIKEAEGVTDENRCQITIADNYYLTSAEEREAVINGIFNALNGLTYLPIELSYYGYPWLKLGDKIKVKDKNDKEYITYVMEHTLKYNGSYSGIIKAIALTKTQQAYKEVLSLKDWRRNTELAVDKINGKMTAVIEEQSEQSEKLTKVEQDVNGITSKVSSVEQSVENITKIEGTAEGKNIYIDDASAEPLIDIMLEGESQQATRDGKNHFDASQIPSSTNIVVSDNGKTITMPIATSGVGYTSTTKKLSELCPKLKVGDIATLRFSRNLGNTYNNFIYLSRISLVWGMNVSKTITQEMLDSNVVLYANRYNEGETGQCILTDFSMMLSSETDTTWEQYGASPSPKYPSPIKNVEGRNKFNYLWFDTTKEVDWTAYQSITSLAKAIPIFIGKGKVATFSSNVPLLSGDNLLYAINDLTKSSGASFALGKTQTVEANNEGYVYVGYIKSRTNYNKVKDGTYYVQVEEGTVAKPYVPYNSLEFKDEGENLYNDNIDDYSKPIDCWICPVALEQGETYKLSGKLKGTKMTGCVIAVVPYGNSYSEFKDVIPFYTALNTAGVVSNRTITVDSSFTSPKLVIYANNKEIFKSIFGNYEIQLNKGTVMRPYKPYQGRKEYFPLSEGQKLYEDSYLANDGTHHTRKQYTFTGNEEIVLSNRQHENCVSFYINNQNIINKQNNYITKEMCSHFVYDSLAYKENRDVECITDNAGIPYRLIIFQILKTRLTSIDVAGFKAYLAEQYANGTPVIVEYELAEEEIVPYTDDQKEAWEKLRHFTLFKGINNITSTANAKITYVRDNGLSDTYETKRNVKENHYTKSETDSQISQTADSIKESVKAINEQTQEKLATLELANQSLEFATRRVGGNNLIRNSAMINDNNFWLAHAKYPYQESDTPPDNPTEGAYWYCTANSGSYIENQMYVYNSGWQVSELSRKSLLSAQNYFAYTTSNEYWANDKNANENTLSGRVIKLDGRQDYTVSHIFNITEPITLNQNENKMAISHFIKNSIVQGNVCVGLMFLNEADFTEVEKPYSLYEPGIILTPDDLKDLTKIEQIIEIPKKSDFIPVVVSNTAPTDTTKNWLDTTIYLPKKYNSQTSQWEILDTKMSLYNESSREVWTYRYFYGFYYQTPIIYDTAEIKSCYVALTFYPAFAVYTGNTEPTPYKGLYWNNKTTNLVKRAKYNNTTFVEWETLDIPSSLLPTGASLGVELFDYIVPIKGFVEIADLKLEYNTMCTQWTQFPGEVYGKNYKMDEKGFWIQSNQNTMFIDEDEILATYKGINIFQINKDLACFYKIQATESIEVGNYFLKTQQINSKNMLLLY